MNTWHDIPITRIDGVTQTWNDYRGKVLLIVNVASRCGFTPQYAGLERLWQTYRERGLVVMGFPCNQFGAQEPGSEAEIAQFCALHYEVSFPMFAKVDVNGGDTHPLYAHLKAQAPGLLGIEMVKWNFTKFLVDRQGNVVSRHAPNTPPERLAADIEKLL
ncbi:MAG: hypothetical protein RLZZ612_2064 [Pseudomonadota bacterium]|jgi:glutathione peroxidase